jgi:hypothetical protein
MYSRVCRHELLSLDPEAAVFCSLQVDFPTLFCVDRGGGLLLAFAFAGVLPLSSPALVGGTARNRRQGWIDVFVFVAQGALGGSQWIATNHRISRKRTESDLMFPMRSDPSWPRVTEKKDGRRPRSCARDEQAETLI